MSIRDVNLAGCLIFLLSLAAFSYGQGKQPSVVLSEGATKQLAKLCSRPGPPSFAATWKPKLSDIVAMESRLSHISSLKAQGIGFMQGSHIEHPNQYFRQYAAIVVNKRKMIYINASCPGAAVGSQHPPVAPPGDSTEDVIDACDGGRCFWGVIYDTATGEFSDLEINGGGG